MNRLCIYPKDVEIITGRSLKHSRYLINVIKRSLGKQEHQFLTFNEFSSFTGIPVREIEAALTPAKRSNALTAHGMPGV